MDMTKKKKLKYIPPKNYVMAVLLIAITIFLVFYFFEWYKVKQVEKYGTSYLIESNTINLEIKSIEEIPTVFLEAPTDYFVFINYLNNDSTYKLEKELKKIIDDYNLKDIFYYMNVTEAKEENARFISELNTTFETNNKIKNIPVLLYYKNGKLMEVASSTDNNIINASDLKRILDVYEIKKP